MKPVIWSESARRDYVDIVRHITRDNPFAAEKVGNAIEKTCNELGRFATGRPGRVSGSFEKSVSRYPYIVAYARAEETADETAIIILRIIHTARNWGSESWPD